MPSDRFRADRQLRHQSILQQCRGTAGSRAVLATEILMRILTLTILALGAALQIAPAAAQTYNPDYPVCLQVFGPANYFDCRYTSIPQCQMTASGRAAQCVVNPYFAGPDEGTAMPYHHRRHRRAY
jgi:hypothetical protein